MSLAVIITTHGRAAEAMLETAEMIIGKQENLRTLSFLPGENADTLAEKMREALDTLDTSAGVLFLVDLYGGSPFNAANRIAQSREHCEVVTGVNIPMLAETLMARDDNPSLEKLTQTAIENGRCGVRQLQKAGAPEVAAPEVATPEVAPEPAPSPTPEVAPAAPASDTLERERAEASRAITNTQLPVLALLRIDDRLIHGQVATRWTKTCDVSRIIVVNDEIARDAMRVTMLKQAVPPGVSAHVVSVDKMVRVLNNPEYAGERFLLLFTRPRDIETLVERGLDVRSVNIGGMAFHSGKVQLDGTVSVDEDDVAAFRALAARGIELEVRKVPSDNKGKVIDLINAKFPNP